MALLGIGERLKIVRGGDSLPSFSEKLGISKSTLARHESEKSYPDAKLLFKICKLFSINPNWLLTGEGPQKTPEPPLGYNEAHNRLKARINSYLTTFIRNLSNREYSETILSDDEMDKKNQEIAEKMLSDDFRELQLPANWGFEKARKVTLAYLRGEYLPSDVELWTMSKTAGFDDFEALRTGRNIGTELEKELAVGYLRQRIAVTDTEILKIVLETVEQIQQKYDAALSIDKKAEILAILYEEVSSGITEVAILPERADRLYKLAV